MLRRKLTKAQYDALSDELKAEYTPEGDGYVIDIEGGLEDTTALRNALEGERGKVRKIAQERDAARARVTELESDDSATASATKLTETEAKLEKANGFIRSTLVEKQAEAIARDLAGPNWALMVPHIAQRLHADIDADTPTTKIMKDGKPSEMTIDDFKKEVVADAKFAAIIVGSKASGGGAPASGQANNKLVPGAGGTGGDDKPKPFAQMKPEELAATLKAKKEAATGDDA